MMQSKSSLEDPFGRHRRQGGKLNVQGMMWGKGMEQILFQGWRLYRYHTGEILIYFHFLGLEGAAALLCACDLDWIG
jgi:hypothetical protein